MLESWNGGRPCVDHRFPCGASHGGVIRRGNVQGARSIPVLEMYGESQANGLPHGPFSNLPAFHPSIFRWTRINTDECLGGLGTTEPKSAKPPCLCVCLRRWQRQGILALHLRGPSPPRRRHHHPLSQQLNHIQTLTASTVVVATMFFPNNLTPFLPPKTGLTADFAPCFWGCKEIPQPCSSGADQVRRALAGGC